LHCRQCGRKIDKNRCTKGTCPLCVNTNLYEKQGVANWELVDSIVESFLSNRLTRAWSAQETLIGFVGEFVSSKGLKVDVTRLDTAVELMFTHMCILDLTAVYTALNNANVYSPCQNNEAYAVMERARSYVDESIRKWAPEIHQYFVSDVDGCMQDYTKMVSKREHASRRNGLNKEIGEYALEMVVEDLKSEGIISNAKKRHPIMVFPKIIGDTFLDGVQIVTVDLAKGCPSLWNNRY